MAQPAKYALTNLLNAQLLPMIFQQLGAGLLFSFPIPSSRATVPTGYGYVLPDQNGWSRYLHFEAAWIRETEGTLKMLNQLTDASLAQAVTPSGRTLGRLAWHLVLSLPEMARHAGLAVAGPDQSAPVPSADRPAPCRCSTGRAVR